MKCPEQKTIGDVDFCKLEECVCLLMGYDCCEEWNKIQEEWAEEDRLNKGERKMQITVKSSKLLTTGDNKYGPWALYKIIAIDEKVYTTLAKGAEVIKEGSIIEPDAITLSEKHEGEFEFKKFSLIEGGTPEPPKPAPPEFKQPESATMTPTDWDRKDALKALSIEQQAIWDGVIQLTIHPELKFRPETAGKVGDLLDHALDWALTHFEKKTKPVAKKAEPEDLFPDEKPPFFKNPGEFMAAAHKLGITGDIILEKLSINNVSEIKDLHEAWKTITAKPIK